MPWISGCLLITTAALLLSAGPAAAAGEIAPYLVTDPGAPPVSEQNVLQRERLWPYYVSLRRAWKPAGAAQALDAQLRGVLIRLESSTHARVDFGRDGLHLVPIGETDLIERANQLRTGELEKTAPNFTLAIGPRLIDSGSDRMRPIPFVEVTQNRGFITVFAKLDELAAMAKALAPLATHPNVLTIVFPQADATDRRVRETLRKLAWPAAFVFDHLAEAYTPSLLPDELRPPAVMLQTAEGRVLFQSAWNDAAGAKLSAAVDENFRPFRPSAP
jgi:hypothetical protein